MDDQNKNNNSSSSGSISNGTVIGQYKIIRKLGAGGMGEVFLAEDNSLHRKVALKFLPTQYMDDEAFKKRFIREARASAKLSHPNIVTIHEVSDYEGRPFFAMEYVEGDLLYEYSRKEKLSYGKIIDIAIKILEGLSKAHREGVTHRDMKPSNIIIDTEDRPQIFDFGLATIEGTEHLTKTGSTIGTVNYMSPEQARGEKTDQRSDLFSFGIVLYEMIAGQTPFARDNMVATANAIATESPPPLTKFRSDVPSDLQRIISKLLEKDPDLRYQTAGGAISDLKLLRRSIDSGQIPTTEIPTAPDSAKSSKGKTFTTIFIVGIIAIFAVIMLVFWNINEPLEIKEQPQKMLLVLPFENLGEPEDEYFADGITDEIMTNLSRLSELGVISRTTAMQYKNTDKTIPQIGRELEVDYVLEGTIRWDRTGQENRVRINPQLIGVSDDSHLWAEKFDAVIDNIFKVQSQIADQVVEALNVTLLESEKKDINVKPTDNIEAYNYYLRGIDYWHEDELEFGIEMMQNAIAEDSSFTQAWAMLSRFYSSVYWFGRDVGQSVIEKAKLTADKAMLLNPDIAESHIAMGYYHYYSSREYGKALEQFSIAAEMQPNNSMILESIAFIRRRMGQWQEAYNLQKKSLELDPNAAGVVGQFIITCNYMRKYDEALTILDRALSLHPDNPNLWSVKFETAVYRYADHDTLLKISENAIERIGIEEFRQHWLGYMLFAEKYREALDFIQKYPPDPETETGSEIAKHMEKAQLYYFMGDSLKAVAYADSTLSEARLMLNTDLPATVRVNILSTMGIIYAALGNKDEALRIADKITEEMPITRDALIGPQMLRIKANIYTFLGENEKAIGILDHLLSIPAPISIAVVKNSPEYKTLRNNPLYQQLIEKYESRYHENRT